MKRIIINLASLALLLTITACGYNNQGQTGTNTNNERNENTINTTEDVRPDTMSNDEDATFDYNATQYNDYMKEKMDELNFTAISIEVKYSDGKEFEANIDQDRNEPIEAELEDELTNNHVTGKAAFDQIYVKIKDLNLKSDSEQQHVIDQILKAFDLPKDYSIIDIDILFNDGNKIDIEKNKQ
ncbi:YusW family protein [Pseudogracilibacillus sp. SE30717A]|uniref:YusW family protein n=1 Tax=Pseudogracilibacillus sp. SE30717A TaxID=3098293 RepID=UPI00300DD49F